MSVSIWFSNFAKYSTCPNRHRGQVAINRDNGLLNGVIFIDHKKAFDTIDHDHTLLQNLQMYGVAKVISNSLSHT